MRPCAVLLMSSEVQAKWMNSETLASSGTAATRSFRKYSTALTSWLVVRSVALIHSASASEKPATSLSRKAWAPAETRNFRDAGVGGQALQPAHLDLDAGADQAVLAEDGAEGLDLGGVAAIDGGKGGQGGKRHGSSVQCSKVKKKAASLHANSVGDQAEASAEFTLKVP